MKSLSKADLARKQELIEAYNEAVEEVNRAHDAYDDAVRELNEKIAAVNEKIEGMVAFAQDIASEIEGYMDERSDTWRESDKGRAYEDWLQEWQCVEGDLPEVDTVETTDLDLPGTDSFENLPDALEY
jgi:chromosome segregation ATPase